MTLLTRRGLPSADKNFSGIAIMRLIFEWQNTGIYLCELPRAPARGFLPSAIQTIPLFVRPLLSPSIQYISLSRPHQLLLYLQSNTAGVSFITTVIRKVAQDTRKAK